MVLNEPAAHNRLEFRSGQGGLCEHLVSWEEDPMRSSSFR